RAKTVTPPGTVSGKAAESPDSSSSVPEPSTSSTSATATEKTVTSPVSLWSSLFAESMSPPSTASTVWTMSPTGYVENGSPTISDADNKALSATELSKLITMAEGRGERLEDSIHAI